MDREALIRFIATGMVVLPLFAAISTGSLDAFAFALFPLLMLFLAVLLIKPDDPFSDLPGEKRREEEDRR